MNETVVNSLSKMGTENSNIKALYLHYLDVSDTDNKFVADPVETSVDATVVNISKDDIYEVMTELTEEVKEEDSEPELEVEEEVTSDSGFSFINPKAWGMLIDAKRKELGYRTYQDLLDAINSKTGIDMVYPTLRNLCKGKVRRMGLDNFMAVNYVLFGECFPASAIKFCTGFEKTWCQQ